MTVDGVEFIGMFLRHILPSGFHRVRFSGYLMNSRKTANLKLIHRLRSTVYPGNPYRDMNVAALMKSLYGKDICCCPECSGRLRSLPRGTPFCRLPVRIKAMIAATE